MLKNLVKRAASNSDWILEVIVMKLTPLADNVLLKHMEAEEKTASGIILSTANKEKSVIAEVIAAGPGTDDVKVTVKPGDKVVTGKYAGQELKLDGEDYVIVKMADILAVVE